MDIEIISKQEIKPASPTPHHLRTYRLSILDQLNCHQYTWFSLFFSPNNQSSADNNNLSEQRKLLKESLSKTLVHFYPVAGKIKDDIHIDCNDDGVYYIEAKVQSQLLDFLRMPENEMINRLFPYHPDSQELLSQNYLLMVQVNFFKCGGIAIGLNPSHKIFDGISASTFIKAWGAIGLKSSVQINPSFISPTLFPPVPNLLKDSISVQPKPKLDEHTYVTKRFVFDKSALDALRAKAATSSHAKPSAVTAVMGLLWKSAIAAFKERCGTRKKSFLLFPMNLRTRSSPPLPTYSFGNILWGTFAYTDIEYSNQELHVLVNHIRNAIANIDKDFVESIKGEERFHKLTGSLKELVELKSDPYNMSKCEGLTISSMCKIGFYEAEFSWGKPIWSGTAQRRTDFYGRGNIVNLTDTKSGDGIEAWVTIKEEVMAILEKNPEFLAYATLNPCPLEV